MQKILKNFIWKTMIMVFAAICFMATSITAYADTSDSDTFIGEANGGSDGADGWNIGYGESSDGADNESGKALNDGNGKENAADIQNSNTNRLVAIIPALLLLAGITGAMVYNKRTYNRNALLGSLDEFDMQYEDYRRYYAYCVEEYLKIERNGTEKSKNSALAIREDMKDIYDKMLEIKKKRELIVPGRGMENKKFVKSSINKMKTLCRSEDQYQKRLERYLNILREINKNNKMMETTKMPA